MDRDTRKRAQNAVSELIALARKKGSVNELDLASMADDFEVTASNIKLSYRETYGNDLLSIKYGGEDTSIMLAKWIAQETIKAWTGYKLFPELNGTYLIEQGVPYIYIGAHYSKQSYPLHYFVVVATRQVKSFTWTDLRANFSNFYDDYLYVFEPPLEKDQS